jgi:hypothetical protein
MTARRRQFPALGATLAVGAAIGLLFRNSMALTWWLSYGSILDPELFESILRALIREPARWFRIGILSPFHLGMVSPLLLVTGLVLGLYLTIRGRGPTRKLLGGVWAAAAAFITGRLLLSAGGDPGEILLHLTIVDACGSAFVAMAM